MILTQYGDDKLALLPWPRGNNLKREVICASAYVCVRARERERGNKTWHYRRFDFSGMSNTFAASFLPVQRSGVQ